MADVTRRAVLTGMIAFAAGRVDAGAPWPDRSITLAHGFPPGGPVDTASRILAEGLSGRLGQSVIVDSRPGATGTIAAGQVARAAPDGYTLLNLPASYTTTAAMHRKLPYRSTDDFSMISMTVEYPVVLATHPEHPIRTLADLVRMAKARETPLQYGTAGIGSLQHLAMEFFAKVANIRLQHIPYRGGAPAITDLLGKRLDFVPDPPTALVEPIRAGQLRAIAVTSKDRFFGLPDVPTIAENDFPDYAVTGFQGIAGPAGLPAGVIERLNAEIAHVLSEPAIVEQLRKLGNNPRASAPGELRDHIAADIARWEKVVTDAGIERI
jgi:tripartite-type tricarboxylate transporter receptor subunit TctC